MLFPAVPINVPNSKVYSNMGLVDYVQGGKKAEVKNDLHIYLAYKTAIHTVNCMKFLLADSTEFQI